QVAVYPTVPLASNDADVVLTAADSVDSSVRETLVLFGSSRGPGAYVYWCDARVAQQHMCFALPAPAVVIVVALPGLPADLSHCVALLLIEVRVLRGRVAGIRRQPNLAGVVEERVGRDGADLGIEVELIGQVGFGITVRIDLDLVEHVVREPVVVGPIARFL